MPKKVRPSMPLIIACLIGILLTSCRQLSSEPSITNSPPLTESYTQPAKEFSLQLPTTWKDHYQVSSDGKTTFFSYVPEDGQPQVVFSIHQATPTQWQQLAQDTTQLATELGSRGSTIYYAQTSPTNPYPSADGQRYQQFSLDVPRILETFDLSPEISSRLELDESR